MSALVVTQIKIIKGVVKTMKNPIIPEAEVKAVKKVIESVKELKEIHKCTLPVFGEETDLDRLHTIAYLHFVKELIEDAMAVKELLEVTREKFEKDVTNNGDIKVEDALRNAMLAEMLKILEDK